MLNVLVSCVKFFRRVGLQTNPIKNLPGLQIPSCQDMRLGARLPTFPHPCHILAIVAMSPRTAFASAPTENVNLHTWIRS